MDLAVTNCSDISVRVNTEFDRRLPRVPLSAVSDERARRRC